MKLNKKNISDFDSALFSFANIKRRWDDITLIDKRKDFIEDELWALKENSKIIVDFIEKFEKEIKEEKNEEIDAEFALIAGGHDGYGSG